MMPAFHTTWPRMLLFIGKDFHGMSSTEKELLTSILLIGAIAGIMFAGRIADKTDRRPTARP
jgi:MFS family permease